jgi:hypothetical protein
VVEKVDMVIKGQQVDSKSNSSFSCFAFKAFLVANCEWIYKISGMDAFKSSCDNEADFDLHGLQSVARPDL